MNIIKTQVKYKDKNLDNFAWKKYFEAKMVAVEKALKWHLSPTMGVLKTIPVATFDSAHHHLKLL